MSDDNPTPQPSQPATTSEELRQQIAKILDDAYQMGVDKGAGRWDDYPKLKPGMLKKLTAYAATVEREGRIDEIKLLDKELGMMSQVPIDITGMMIDKHMMSRTPEEIAYAKEKNNREAWVGVKVEDYKRKRLAALQGPIQGDSNTSEEASSTQ